MKSLFAWWVYHLETGTDILKDYAGKSVDGKPVIVKNGERKFDVSRFLTKHPGGSSVLRLNSGKDVKKQMCGTHKHSAMAYCLLEEYAVDLKPSGLTEEYEMTRAKEDIESKVDWSRGMVCQVGSLGPSYEKWLDFPVDRELRLFDFPLLERMTRTSWYTVPIVWCPIVVLLLTFAARSLGRSIGAWVLPGFVSGFLAWSLLEYSLHRFLFHMPVPKDSPTLITLHFLLHGLHHKVPFDPDRLVFPPLGAFLVSLPVTLSIFILFPVATALLIISGLFTGYILYDLCHYYLHHGDPAPTSFLHQLKRYHAHHHFMHHNQGFGITSKFWDKYFGTEIEMKM